MQFTLTAAAALVATASASNLVHRATFNNNETCNTANPITKVVNRCSYPVYLWSIDKQLGCPEGTGLELKTGDFYHENFQDGTDGGISIKLSKSETCGGKDISQLEYKIVPTGDYKGNYLDMSFVDCTGDHKNCPGREDGFYLKSGNKDGAYASAVNNEHCPIFSVNNAEEAAKVSYIKWDDRQTKFCDLDASLALYLCGGEAPDADDNYSPVPVSSAVSSAAPSSSEIKSSSSAPSSSPKPSSPAPVASSSSSTEEGYVVAAAAVTEAPEVPSPSAPVVKTEVVYVTQYVKRHAHARRHQHFHA